MFIGIILGFILGIILLLVGMIGTIIYKRKGKSKQWPNWVFIAGVCAILTAMNNSINK